MATVRQAQIKAWPAGFAHVIVDEGSMVPVSDGMALLIQQELGQRDGSLLVFGDPKQLPPIGLRVDALDDEDAEGGAQAMVEELRRLNGLWLETSFQGRLMERHPERLSMVMLNEQSRMNPTLCGVVSAEQYEGELVPTATAPAPGVPPWLTGGICVLHPLEPPAWLRPALHERPGPRRPRHAGGSRYQVQVARASIALARHLAGRGIGVLLCSPYRAQAGLLRRGVADLPHVRAGTVHRVQGEEADVAIFDPAMAGSYFIRHSPIAARLVNVAASRARRALVLCNAPVYLRQNPLLSPFVDAATTL